MQKKTTLSFLGHAILMASFVIALAPSAKATALCSKIFVPASETVWFPKGTTARYVVHDNSARYLPLQKPSDKLRETLSQFSDPKDTSVFVSSFELLNKVPNDTEQIQYLGYNLMAIRMHVYYLDGFRKSSVFVSTKTASIDDLVSKILDSANAGGIGEKTRQDIENQIEMIAAKVGPPGDRTIIESFASEPEGMRLSSFSIINRQTRVVVDINFLDYPFWLNPK